MAAPTDHFFFAHPGRSQESGLSANPILRQRKRPGHIPVRPAKDSMTTGRYRNQWTLSKPVSHMPNKRTIAIDKKSILYALMFFSSCLIMNILAPVTFSLQML